MSHNQRYGNTPLPAPCIVDQGIVVNKSDMQRLLDSLDRVRYIYTQGDDILSESEGCVMEVFAEPVQATLVTNHALYLNVCSFDYLEITQSGECDSCFDLVQESYRLRLIPLSNPLQDQNSKIVALEAMMAEVLSATWDVRLDDEQNFSM
jgi:7-keto-8-aminopelargonate synthetase-like enzyme